MSPTRQSVGDNNNGYYYSRYCYRCYYGTITPLLLVSILYSYACLHYYLLLPPPLSDLVVLTLSHHPYNQIRSRRTGSNYCGVEENFSGKETNRIKAIHTSILYSPDYYVPLMLHEFDYCKYLKSQCMPTFIDSASRLCIKIPLTTMYNSQRLPLPPPPALPFAPASRPPPALPQSASPLLSSPRPPQPPSSQCRI